MSSILRRHYSRASFFALALLVGGVNADDTSSFVWGFKTWAGTTLPECERIQVFVDTSGAPTTAAPPYTLIAYEAAGIPTVQYLGSDPNDLWWTVDHAAQSQLILSIADSAGNSGGVSTHVFNVVSSTAGSSCHQQNPTSPISITTNTTKVISSCDVLPLKISGGSKPYTITVASLDSNTVTNFTLGRAFDTYNWVNRASPNSQLIASVSDANGVYAASTNILQTSGSSDLTCGNRPSVEIDSTGQASSVETGAPTATASASASPASNSSASKSPSTGTIIAIAVGGLVLIGALLMGAFFFFRRRKEDARAPRGYGMVDNYSGFGLGGSAPGQNARYSTVGEENTPFVMPGGQGTPYTDSPYQRGTYVSNYSNMPSEGTLPPVMHRGSTYSLSGIPQSVAPQGAMLYAGQQRMVSTTDSSRNSVSGSSTSRAYTTGPMVPSSPSEYTPPSVTSVGQWTGAAYAALGTSGSGSGSGSGSVSGSAAYPVGMSASGSGSGPATMLQETMAETGPLKLTIANPGPNCPPVAEGMNEKQGPIPPQRQESVIIQHEDVSDVVELPPAYKERSDH